ncbi:uncharacterized protein TrAtP1_001504 [Trichoderma atroviride]|uniref:uncharacterized protein n=1 Tax=Hypocrea atroviridis TaxID=63577 RepID=UPI003316AD39|nr:hypothetical protein TrAtP1_001504 [Trichoderma atroviride]
MELGPQPAQVPARNYLHSSINTHNLLALGHGLTINPKTTDTAHPTEQASTSLCQRGFAPPTRASSASIRPSVHPSIQYLSTASFLLRLPNDAIDLSIAQATVKTALELSQPIIPQPTHTVWLAESLWRRQREGCGAHMPPRKEGPCSGLEQQL